MGLMVSIYRSDYDSALNHFKGRKKIVVVNVDGPFSPNDEMPAALLIAGPGGHGHLIVVPAELNEDGEYVPLIKNHACRMDGGTIADWSDSRWSEATGRRPVRIHDRFEVPL